MILGQIISIICVVYLRLFVEVKPYSFRLLFQGNVLAFRLLIINENSAVAHALTKFRSVHIFFYYFQTLSRFDERYHCSSSIGP